MEITPIIFEYIREDHGFINPQRLTYPDGTIVEQVDGRLSMSKCADMIGHPIEVIENGKSLGVYKLRTHGTLPDSDIQFIDYGPTMEVEIKEAEMIPSKLEVGMVFRASPKLIEETRKEVEASDDPVLKHGHETMEMFLYHDFSIATVDVENDICSVSSVILCHMAQSLGQKDHLQHYKLSDVMRTINDGYWLHIPQED